MVGAMLGAGGTRAGLGRVMQCVLVGLEDRLEGKELRFTVVESHGGETVLEVCLSVCNYV